MPSLMLEWQRHMRGIPRMAYSMVTTLPQSVFGAMWPYPADTRQNHGVIDKWSWTTGSGHLIVEINA